jgi:hypothetical protein
MPYIAQKDRPALDVHIDALAAQIRETTQSYGSETGFAGLLNYSFTTLALKVSPGKRYWISCACRRRLCHRCLGILSAMVRALRGQGKRSRGRCLRISGPWVRFRTHPPTWKRPPSPEKRPTGF